MYNYNFFMGLTIQHTDPVPTLAVTSYHTTLLARC